MSQTPIPTPPKRSVGLKLLLVCALALVMSIPAAFVWALIYERTSRAQGVVDEISQMVGGPGQFMGPVLAVPYEIPEISEEGKERSRSIGTYIVFPKTGEAEARVETEQRERGLFKAPVWTADITMDAHFDLTETGAAVPLDAVLDWSRAEIVVGVADPRGALESSLTVDGETTAMEPSLVLDAVGLTAAHEDYRRGPDVMQFFAVPAPETARPGAEFDAEAELSFSGAQRIAFLAYAENTEVRLTGDWPGPSYDGAFATREHTDQPPEGVSVKDGKGYFSVRWSAPFTARGVAPEGTLGVIGQLSATSMGATFVESANPYQAVTRALKYAPIFLGLVFFAYFVFETTQKRRIHPAQYILVGLAQLVFYLLLLAIAERIGFDGGFLIAAGATVGLISAYAGWAFESRAQGFVALIAFSFLYGLIYVLMRLQDWALLVGALTSFAAIAAVMWFTRKVDWYGEGRA